MNKTKTKLSIFALLVVALMMVSVASVNATPTMSESTWFSGYGVPIQSKNAGSMYIDLNTNNFYVSTGTCGDYQWSLIGCLIGKDGVDGTDGIDGTNGIDGLNGLNGIDGKDGINGTNGLNGAQGIQGLTGAVGATGATGLQGVQGIQGLTGLTGLTGMTGMQGLTGMTGAIGAQGLQGVAGTNGTNGVNGKDGYSIISGEGNPNFNDNIVGTTNTLYVDAVTGETWVYIVEVTSPTSYTSGWYLQGTIKGEDGVDGVNGLNGTNGAKGIALNPDYTLLFVIGAVCVGSTVALGVYVYKKNKF